MPSSSLTRRWFLHLTTATTSVLLAGCLQGEQPATDPSTSHPSHEVDLSTPTPGECQAIDHPLPTATAELEPKAYPDYPDELSPSRASSFATTYELAYWHNWVVATDWMAGTDEVTFEGVHAPSWAMTEHRDGYIVGVTGELKTADARPPPDRTPGTQTPTRVPFLDDPFSAWYYLSPRFALRKERDESFPVGEKPEPDLADAAIIVCN